METKNSGTVGDSLIVAAKEIRSRGSNLGEIVKQKAQAAILIEEMTSRIESTLAPIIAECESGSMQPEVALQRILAANKGVISFMKSTSKNLVTEAQQTKGYAEGFAAAVSVLEEMGAAINREEARVSELAESEVDLEARRKPGTRPETLRVKRKASELRGSKGDLDDAAE